MWVAISSNEHYRRLTTGSFSLAELFPALKDEPKWTRQDTYTTMGLVVEQFNRAQWVRFGVPIDEPAFASPRAFYHASIDGVDGLDKNVPTGVLTKSERKKLNSRIDRTPKRMNDTYFKLF